MTTEYARKKYLYERTRVDKIIDSYCGRDFSEYTCKKGGDILCFRVYGNDARTLRMTER